MQERGNEIVQCMWGLEMGSVKEDAHETTREGSGDRDGHDPAHENPSDSSPVGRADITVAKRNANGGTDDAHGGGDGDAKLSGQDDGDGRGEFHGETAGRGHEGDAVTEDGHDLVTVGGKTDDEHTSSEGQSPDGDGSLFSGELTSGPDVVDDGEGSDGVGNIVGTVGEGGNTGSQDLEE